jgi:DNA-binding MarR family transcriptional regulator
VENMLIKRDILELETRRRIYNYIFEHPGLHLRRLSKELEIPLATLKYHLKSLIKHDLIIGQTKNRYLRYYVKDKVGNGEKKIMPFLRQKASLNIILYLLIWTGASQIELSKNLKKHPTTINFHLKKLIKAGIIERFSIENGIITIPRWGNIKFFEYLPISNEKIYILKDQNIIHKTIIVYKNNFSDDRLVTAALSLIENLITDDELYKKSAKKTILNFNSRIDELTDYINEVFPHPYHI